MKFCLKCFLSSKLVFLACEGRSYLGTFYHVCKFFTLAIPFSVRGNAVRYPKYSFLVFDDTKGN